VRAARCVVAQGVPLSEGNRETGNKKGTAGILMQALIQHLPMLVLALALTPVRGAEVCRPAIPGVKIVGSTFALVESSNSSACCDLCSANPNCIAFTLTDGATCALHANASDYTNDVMSSVSVVRDWRSVHQGGRYGHWGRDTDGMPFYNYTFDQIADSAQASPVQNPLCNSSGRSSPQWCLGMYARTMATNGTFFRASRMLLLTYFAQFYRLVGLAAE
jgi:hypothetical protein